MEQTRAKSVGRTNIRARYISQNQKLQQSSGNGGININNLNTNLINSQLLINQLQSTKNNEEDTSYMKKSSSYRIKQNLNASSAGKNINEVLAKSQIYQQSQIYPQSQVYQQSSTKNTNNINNELEQANHTASSGVFHKKTRNYSNGGVNSPFRNKVNSGSKGVAAVLVENRQKNSSSQSYHFNANVNVNVVSTNNINTSDIEEASHTASGIFLKKNRNNSHGGGNLPHRNKINSNSGNAGQIDNLNKNSPSQGYNNNMSGQQAKINNGNMPNSMNFMANQTSKNMIESSANQADISNMNNNHLTETQMRQSRINNLKSYISNNYNNILNSDEVSKPSSSSQGVKTQNNILSTQGMRASSQKNPPGSKHATHYGYFQNQPDKVQPLKALHNFTDSDIQLSSQKNTQELSSGRQQNEKDSSSTATQAQKKDTYNSKQDHNSMDDQSKGNDYLQNINNSLNYFKNIGQSYSTNTSSLLSQQISEKDANIEEMHFYAVEFQQNCNRWLSQIEKFK